MSSSKMAAILSRGRWVQHKERLITEHTKSSELIYYLIVIIITVTEEIHMVMIDLTCIKIVLKLVYDMYDMKYHTRRKND